jgi:leader peptidase (prepilin peptidase) / N-methyltransferase
MQLIIPVLFSGYIFDTGLNQMLHPPRYPCTAIISAISYVILFFTFHDSLLIMKGFLFALLLILAGYIDQKTHEIPNELCVLILLDGLILISPVRALIGLFVVSLPMLILGVVLKGGVGGGDIKLMAACGVVLGPMGVMEGVLISSMLLLLFLLIRLIRIKQFSKMNAMAPYFAVGCFIAYLLEFKG